MAGKFLVKFGEVECNIQCEWTLAPATSPSHCWQSLNVLFWRESSGIQSTSLDNTEPKIFLVQTGPANIIALGQDHLGSLEAFGLFTRCMTISAGGDGYCGMKLIVPTVPGYIARSDILALRMVDCVFASETVSFAQPRQRFTGQVPSIETFNEFVDAASASIGGIRIHSHSKEYLPTSLALLEIEVQNRLSFPWLTIHPISRQTLALVEGGRSDPEHAGTANSIYLAAKALGIEMVVLDTPGHWIQDGRYSHWRKAFLPIDLTPDSSFTQRIVDTVRAYDEEIHGILTFCDSYQVAVSSAARQLSLPAAPTAAYEIATDKYKTGVFDNRPAYRATNVEEAISIVQGSARETGVDFPLIIKPCNGWLSEGVFKVNNQSELVTGIRSIDNKRHGCEFVIEKYCGGPEVDANFVICEGELLFFEASDDFPKSAEVNTSRAESFIELDNILPSKLPHSELNILQNTLYQALLRLGFESGVFHLEARIQNSRMDYMMDKETGLIDLAWRECSSSQPAPSIWLIEINPRPPGYQVSGATTATYGVDYWALSLLFALGDTERVRALSHPFSNRHQYHCDIVGIPVEHGGIFDSEDVCVELMTRLPQLAENITKYFCCYKKGDKVLDPSTGVNSWVAFFSVFSRISRTDCLEKAATIRREIRFSILPEN